ncbi:endonuclease VIII [Paenibacillus pasadenensis]|uniref:Fpg/Nei family DNA glycosylase n=1 Tax=Paenibacillus pasadenensis TaxID=217090 RepID=UPI00203AFE5F|nr:DNA-formamidopyrimidine glycosylase family protein [Paenibacillus pasadenensis]MCM3748948.1 endonuclease VIII [Paenibacillus pasadenensis]
MPEYPEMDHYRIMLSSEVAGKRIRSVQVGREKSLNVPADEFVRQVEGRTVWFIERRGKHLLFHLDNGQRLLLHLMLGGWMFFGSEEEKPDRTVQVKLEFDNGSLFFIGLRLGYLHLLTAREADKELAKLGPEPLDPRLTLERFNERLMTKKRSALKTALVDQSVIAGIGNCYADEIAWQAELLPNARIGSLTQEAVSRLYDAMHNVLLEAKASGGYMEYPFRIGDTVTGGYNDECKVYDRPGEACSRCGGTIVQEEQSSRKVFFCPDCQKDQ